MNTTPSWSELTTTLAAGIQRALRESLGLADEVAIQFERPPRPEMGDLAFGCFSLAKALRKAPPMIATSLAQSLRQDLSLAPLLAAVEVAGPYVNLRVHPVALFGGLDRAVHNSAGGYGRSSVGQGRKILVEFSSPNTNKPLHLGHIRNNALGWSVATLLEMVGYEVIRANLVNDRGIHICKSMIAYRHFGGDTTPESAGKKGDHLVGDFYVRFSSALSDQVKALLPAVAEETGLTGEALKDMAEAKAPLTLEAQEMLRLWEAGDPEVRLLWAKMNGWAIGGLKATYARMGIQFDRYYFESQTYERGRGLVLEHLEKGLFYRKEDGSVWVDLSEEGLESKLLLRRDGTSIYMTQDIGTTVIKQEQTQFDQSLFVVADEQDRHFQVLFAILRKMGYDWAHRLTHLSYGMVNLPEGKMKSREGTVVDADDLMDELEEACLEKAREAKAQGSLALSDEQLRTMAAQVAQAALKFFILKVSPRKTMIFNPAESVNLQGDTGPYVQYAHARICSILSRGREHGLNPEDAGKMGLFHLLGSQEERQLALALSHFPEVVVEAAEKFAPSTVGSYLLEVAGAFNRFYHDHPVLKADPDLARARLALCAHTAVVLKEGLRLMGIDAPEAM